jgi:hypothetical protein
MPPPPPVTPTDATVEGRLVLGGGSGCDEMWAAGAGCTVPVTSDGGAEFDA